MSLKQHDDQCPGCRPALIDTRTRQPLPDDSPEMVKVMQVWSRTTRDQREAFHRVTCQNSRFEGDLRIVAEISRMMTEALSKK